MDVLERLNRRFGSWYEGLFGASPERDLRPRDILRRILAAMEDQRREGLDGQIYVPNCYTLQIAVHGDDERQYLRTFLDAQELVGAVRRAMEQHGYKTRGGLRFTIEEIASHPDEEPRVTIACRFDANIPDRPLPMDAPEDVDDRPHSVPPSPRRPLPDYGRAAAAPHTGDHGEDEEMGTLPAAMGMAAMAALVPQNGGEPFPLTGRGAQIGRGRQAGNDLVLGNDAMISKTHARIVFDRGRFSVSDLGSTNGTFVNERQLPAGTVQPLTPGDVIRFGATTLIFQPGRGASSAPPPQAPEAHVSAPPSQKRAGFRLVAGDGEEHLLASQMMVGRALTGDIVLHGNGVAAQHARLTVRPESGQVFVEDLNSPGGTLVNGERIPAQFPVALYEGDQVVFGEVLLRLERLGGAAAPGGGQRA